MFSLLVAAVKAGDPSTKMKDDIPQTLRNTIIHLGEHVRATLTDHRNGAPAGLADVSRVTEADTLYGVDALVEPALLAWLGEHWPAGQPVEIVMEGLEEAGAVTFPSGTPIESTRWKLIIDPIDGTRMIMHDKRSAWMIGALAPQRGPVTNLRDIIVSVIVELPTTKQTLADTLSAVRGSGVQGHRTNLLDGTQTPLTVAPYRGTEVTHAFSSLVKFFLGAKERVARIEQDALVGAFGSDAMGAMVFDDQYISTAGQFHEILTGRDRWLGDIRPLIFAAEGWDQVLVCHPYDVGGALLLEEAGCVIEKPDGTPLDAPLDTTSPVAWVAYANPRLAEKLRGPLREAIRRELG